MKRFDLTPHPSQFPRGFQPVLRWRSDARTLFFFPHFPSATNDSEPVSCVLAGERCAALPPPGVHRVGGRRERGAGVVGPREALPAPARPIRPCVFMLVFFSFGLLCSCSCCFAVCIIFHLRPVLQRASHSGINRTYFAPSRGQYIKPWVWQGFHTHFWTAFFVCMDDNTYVFFAD